MQIYKRYMIQIQIFDVSQESDNLTLILEKFILKIIIIIIIIIIELLLIYKEKNKFYFIIIIPLK